MPSENVLCSKVWLLKLSSDFNELLESFVPRQIRKWLKFYKVLICERNMALVYCFVYGREGGKKPRNKGVKISVRLNWHIVSVLLVTYGSLLLILCFH